METANFIIRQHIVEKEEAGMTFVKKGLELGITVLIRLCPCLN
jgi:hypothetical protein